jgi:hypothetical protein
MSFRIYLGNPTGGAAPTSNIKSVSAVAWADIKTVSSVAVANIKSVSGINK